MSTFDRVARRAAGAVFEVRTWHVALAILLATIVLMALAPEAGVVLLVFGAMAVFLTVWAREFLGLMALRDEDLPGRNDKAIWGTLFVLLPPVGLVMFLLFRRGYPIGGKPESGPDLG